MNKLLADGLRVLNGLIAVLIILFGAVLAAAMSAGHQISLSFPLMVGAFVGLLVAIIVCGVLALFIEMRNELVKIRVLLDYRSTATTK